MRKITAAAILAILVFPGVSWAKDSYVRPHMNDEGKIVSGHYIKPGGHSASYWYTLDQQENAHEKEGYSEPFGPIYTPPQNAYMQIDETPALQGGFKNSPYDVN